MSQPRGLRQSQGVLTDEDPQNPSLFPTCLLYIQHSNFDHAILLSHAPLVWRTRPSQ